MPLRRALVLLLLLTPACASGPDGESLSGALRASPRDGVLPTSTEDSPEDAEPTAWDVAPDGDDHDHLFEGLTAPMAVTDAADAYGEGEPLSDDELTEADWARAEAELDAIFAAERLAEEQGMSVDIVAHLTALASLGDEPWAADAAAQVAPPDVGDDPFAATDDDRGAAEQPGDAGADGDKASARCGATAKHGWYCGGDKVSGAARHTLYLCDGPSRAPTRSRPCASGCVVAPAGSDDYCAATPAPRCGPSAKRGAYCGDDKMLHAETETLYRCEGPNRAPVRSARCAHGCTVAPPGQDDYCRRAPQAQPTCGGDAQVGDYCGGDKVSNARSDTLYRCAGPGRPTRAVACAAGCVVARAGADDFCRAPTHPEPRPQAARCPAQPKLKWGLHPRASDELRCAGVPAWRVGQTIGNAAASAGYHAKDGSAGGEPYGAAVDLSTYGLSNTQIRVLLSRLADHGHAAFFRRGGMDGWPSGYSGDHIHAVYVGAAMKWQLDAQVKDWLAGYNGLAHRVRYRFWQPTSEQRSLIGRRFAGSN